MTEKINFEKMLSQAFDEYAEEEFGRIADNGQYTIPKKELKWAKQQDHRRRYKKTMWKVYLQRCAAVLLVLCSVSAAILASSVEARAAVKEFFSEWFNKFIEIFYVEDETEDADIYLYDVSYIPEGFEVGEKKESDTVRRYTYNNGTQSITIEIANTKNATVSADSTMNSYDEIWLGSHNAYVLYDNETNNGAVVFGDRSITVSVEGYLSREELVRMAKGINMNEANILGYVREFADHTADLPNIATYEYTSAISDFSFTNLKELSEPVTVGFRIPETWSEEGNSCERLLPDLSYYCIASSSSVVLYEVEPDFVLDCNFHETQAHKYVIPHNTFEAKKISEYRTGGGFDSVIYYQYDDANNIFLTAFIRLSDTLIMEIDLNDSSENAAQMLDILDSVKLGVYEEPEKAEKETIRFNFDKLTDKEKEYYLMLESGDISEDTVFSGDDAKAVRTAIKLYRINTQLDAWRYGFILYSAYIPDYSKDQITVAQTTVDEYPDEGSERLYDLEIDVRASRIAQLGSDYEKVKNIAEILYNNVIHTTGDYSYESTPIAAISASRADCIGVSYAFEALCRSINIETATVYATDTKGHYLSDGYKLHNHAWNIVKIDGKWYHIDVARMMADRESEDPFAKYFLISDDEISKYNGEFGLMPYVDDTESPAFKIPPSTENYSDQ